MVRAASRVWRADYALFVFPSTGALPHQFDRDRGGHRPRARPHSGRLCSYEATVNRRMIPKVTNFLWIDGKRGEDPPVALRGGGQPGSRFTGQYANHVQRAGRHTLIRDALGVVKLFFAISPDGQVHSSNYIVELVRRGHRLTDIS